MRRALLLALVLCLALAAPAAASHSQFTIFEAPNQFVRGDNPEGTLDEIHAFGVHWIRVTLYWRSVAPSPDAHVRPAFDETDPAAYAWGPYDRLMAAARARGIRVLLTVTGPVPDWASASHRSAVTRPSPTRFQRFMEAVGRHYGAQVGYWSIWNEPNHPDFLRPQYVHGRPYSPRMYRRLFQAAEKGLNASGNRRDRVLMGETAPIGTSKVVAPLTFLRGTLCLNSHYHKARDCGRLGADGYAHHAYFHGAPWVVPRSSNAVTIGTLSRLTRALDRAGRAHAIRRGMGIYLTEFGVQSRPDPFIGVSFTAQAEFRSMAERIAYRNPRVRAFSQYLMTDDHPRAGPASQRYSGFESGLRTSSGRAKLSYDGFRLPLVAHRGHRRVTLWGLVRPHRGRATVSIDYRSRHGRAWHLLKRDRTDSRGYWTTTTRYSSGRSYRVRWRDPSGVWRAGPMTRVYSRG